MPSQASGAEVAAASDVLRQSELEFQEAKSKGQTLGTIRARAETRVPIMREGRENLASWIAVFNENPNLLGAPGALAGPTRTGLETLRALDVTGLLDTAKQVLKDNGISEEEFLDPNLDLIDRFRLKHGDQPILDEECEEC